MRSDQNSAFGTDFQRVLYPKASISWILSDEEFFPGWSWLDQLRIRSAYGVSGVQPGSNDAIRSFEAAIPNVAGTDVPAIRSATAGNKDLKPERSTEIEAGFETKMFSNRVSLDFTFYRKRTKDALINAVLAPSAGTGATAVRRNLGQIQNNRFEVITNLQLVDRNAFAWDLALSGSTNSNKLISLGETPPQIGVSTRVIEGYPLFGWWARPITGWEDKNGDNILTYNADPNLNEVFVGDSAVFRGYTQPRHIVTLTMASISSVARFAFRRCSITAAATRHTTIRSASGASAVRTATGWPIRQRASRSRRWSWRRATILRGRSTASTRTATS